MGDKKYALKTMYVAKLRNFRTHYNLKVKKKRERATYTLKTQFVLALEMSFCDSILHQATQRERERERKRDKQ